MIVWDFSVYIKYYAAKISSEEEFLSVFHLSIRRHILNWKYKNLYSIF